VLLIRWLGEVGAQAEEVVDKLFHDGPPPHYMDAMQDLIPLLKNKIKISPLRDGASAEGYA
jgi:hypothetical protein